jgi:hypothetical protein
VRPLTLTLTNQARYTYPKCEVLYCSLDCYQQHGDSNTAVVDAAASLVGASGVLGRDQCWGCMEQVLAACTTESTKAVRSGIGCHISRNTLTKDVELLCTSVQLIACALLEAPDIFKAARQVVNKSGLQTTTEHRISPDTCPTPLSLLTIDRIR